MFILHKNFLVLCLFTTIFAFPNKFLIAQQHHPFFSCNQSPFIQVFGMPVPGTTSNPPVGDLQINLIGKIANNHSWDFTSDKLVYLDGETRKILAHFEYGISRRFSLNFLATYVQHSGGFTDSFIYNFHKTFRLPQGRRNVQYNNNLNYLYRSQETTRLWLSNNRSHFGDTQLFLSVDLQDIFQNTRLSGTIKSGIKFATGHPDQLTGSGSNDYWLQVNSGYSFFIKNIPSSLYLSFGVLRVGEFSIMKEIQHNHVLFGANGIGLGILPWLSIQTQIDWHTPFYDSHFDQLGKFSGQIVIGGTIHLMDLLQVQLGISEDLLISTSSDVVFYGRIGINTR